MTIKELIQYMRQQTERIERLTEQLAAAKERAKRLRDVLEGSSRIVEKYKDACMEWAKESHHKGGRQDTEFWERRAKSMAILLTMNEQALKE